jgi:hypothetical protein
MLEAFISKVADEKNRLAVILIVGLIHGLIYVFLTPPWWHHDEAGHFQVARFIADHEQYPNLGEYDEALREELILSLDEYDLLENMGHSLDSVGELHPVILALQAGDPPLYYMLASLPLRLLKNTNIAVQNRALRILSLSFFLLTLWASWGLAGELFGMAHPLRSISVIFLALLPGFLNEMTAIGNAPLGTFLFAFFLLNGVRLLKYGFSWKIIGLFGAGAVASFYANNLIWVSIAALTAQVILFLLFYKYPKWIPWAITSFVLIIVILFVFEWGEARYWYGNVPRETQARQLTEKSPFGNYALQLPSNQIIRQRIPMEFLKPLRSKTVTLGFWAWASSPVEINTPTIIFSYEGGYISSPKKSISLDLVPNFYSVQVDIPFNSRNGWLDIDHTTNQEIDIYFDQIVLADGMWDEGMPQFDDSTSRTGLWRGDEFENLIRNSSFEKSWFNISALAWRKLLARFPYYFSTPALVTVMDWESSGWYLKKTYVVFNETFWGRFGPSTLPMLGAPYIYQLLRSIFLLGLIGIVVFIWQKFKILDKRPLFILGLSTVIIWGQALLRGAGSLEWETSILITWARYALPAFVPTAMILSAGWFSLTSIFFKGTGVRKTRTFWIIFLALLISIDILAIFAMQLFFYLRAVWPYLLLFGIVFFSLIFIFQTLEKQLASEEVRES